MTPGEVIAAFGIVLSLIGGGWLLLSIAGRQFEKRLGDRFKAMEKSREEGRRVWDERFKGMEGRLGVQERDLSGLTTTLPIHDVRREDAIRGDVQVNAKLDAINDRLDRWMDRWTQERKP
jgi:hypothetical protein